MHAGLGLMVVCVQACGHPSRSPDQPDRRPQLIVVSPRAGNVWTEGESYTIRWRATGIARVNVGLALGGKDKGHPALNLPASTDSLRWQVPEGFVSGFGLQRSDVVRVRVEDAGDPTRFADSPPFRIVARAASAPSRNARPPAGGFRSESPIH
jgi:hypothetical protein